MNFKAKVFYELLWRMTLNQREHLELIDARGDIGKASKKITSLKQTRILLKDSVNLLTGDFTYFTRLKMGASSHVSKAF